MHKNAISETESDRNTNCSAGINISNIKLIYNPQNKTIQRLTVIISPMEITVLEIPHQIGHHFEE
jgi:hypothetical protein